MNYRSIIWGLLLAACSDHGGPATVEEAISACITFGSCFTDDGISVCYRRNLPHLQTQQIRCLAQAGSNCSRAAECLGVYNYTFLEPCRASTDSCVNERRYFCQDAVQGEIDCRQPSDFEDHFAPNARCMSGTSGRAACAIGTCSTAMSMCEGNRQVKCSDGLLVAYDCAARNETCVTDPTTSASQCSPSATQLNCDEIIAGTMATTVDNQTFCRFGSECDPSHYSTTCSGSMITFCASGLLRTVDCAAIGFSSCGPRSCIPRL